MFDHYAEQGLSPGRTIAYEVTELRNVDGTHPLLHVEHLGAANVSLVEEQIAKAGSVDAPEGTDTKLTRSRDLVARHAVRKLERVYRGDGTPATDADIAAFIRSIPLGAFTRLIVFVTTEDNFVRVPIATKPSELAEKS